MQRQMFRSKIHRATVTQADLHYEGSMTIDETLLEAADIIEFEAIHVWNVTRGTRLKTYVLKGERDSGVICMNGAAAHQNEPGDLVIIATFGNFDEAAARAHVPKNVFVDENNRIKQLGAEVPGPARRVG